MGGRVANPQQNTASLLIVHPRARRPVSSMMVWCSTFFDPILECISVGIILRLKEFLFADANRGQLIGSISYLSSRPDFVRFASIVGVLCTIRTLACGQCSCCSTVNLLPVCLLATSNRHPTYNYIISIINLLPTFSLGLSVLVVSYDVPPFVPTCHDVPAILHPSSI